MLQSTTFLTGERDVDRNHRGAIFAANVIRVSGCCQIPVFHDWSCTPGVSLVTVALRGSCANLEADNSVIHSGIMPTGSLLICRPGLQVRAMLSGDYDFIQVRVSGGSGLLSGRVDDQNTAAGLAEGYELRLRDPLMEHLGRTLLMHDSEDSEYVSAVGTLIAMWLSRVTSHGARPNPLSKWRLKRVQDLVEQRIDRPLTLEDLAAAAGLSRMHFAGQFRAATGLRPHDFVVLRRIERAKELMTDTRASLVQVALDCGFQAQSHFSTVFKRFTGESPGAWRRRHQAGSEQRPNPGAISLHLRE